MLIIDKYIKFIKNIKTEVTKITVLGLLVFFAIQEADSQALVTVSNDAIFTVNSGAIVKINGGITFGTLSSGTMTQYGFIDITGDWTNNRAIDSWGGMVSFVGSTPAVINGTQASIFYNLDIDKTGGAVVSMNQNVQANNSILVNNGVLRYDNTLARTLSTYGSLTINATGTLDVATTGTARTHILDITANIANNGTLNLNPSGAYVCNTKLTNSSNSVLSGTGATNKFNLISSEKNAYDYVSQVNSTNFQVPAGGFLSLSMGIFRISGNFTVANQVFTSAAYTIGDFSGFWLDNPNFTVVGQAVAANVNLSGSLRIDNGIYNVGTGTNQINLLYNTGSVYSGGPYGSSLRISNGTLNVVGRFSRDGTATSKINYIQTGGTVRLGTGAVSSATNRGAFDLGDNGSSIDWEGGTIELNRASSNSGTGGAPNGDFVVQALTNTITSSALLKINAAIAAQSFRINSIPPIGELQMIGTNNPVVSLMTNDLSVLSNITIAGTTAPSLNSNNLNIFIGGNWINNSVANGFSAGTAKVTFNGSADQYLQGTVGNTFNHFSINKSGGKVIQSTANTINGNMNLISANALFDIQTFDLTLGNNSIVYSGDGVGSSVDPGLGFTATKCILYSQAGIGGGSIKKNLSAGTISSSTIFGVPIGTTGVYTPLRLTTYNATIGAGGGWFRFKPVPMEHPNVQATNVSLKKYWTLSKNNITFNTPEVYDLNFFYDDSEIFGTEGSYRVLRYNAGWTIDPGVTAVVAFNTNRIISERPTDAQFAGDWTAGEEQAARSTYYSIANGNYNAPASWSKVSYGGSVSGTAPTFNTDRVYIGDGKTITLTANTPAVNKTQVDVNGTLVASTYTVLGDTFKLSAGATLKIGSAQGIVSSGATGNIQTTVRTLDTAAVYFYNSSTASQATGNALPTRVRGLVIDNTFGGGSVTLANNMIIGDSLVINNGIFNIGTNSINGEVPNRTMIMRGGTFTIGTDFPTNYTPPTFNAGTINFNGTAALSIPSSGSTPGVNQYFNLTLAGARQYNTFTFESAGEIRIGGTLSISTATFQTFQTARFLTSGSTIVFNGSGPQSIPRTTTQGGGSDYELTYYNLKLSGTGIKSLADANHIVQNNLTIENGSTFALNTRSLTVFQNWTNNGGTFTPGTNAVTLSSYAIGDTNEILSAGQAFYDLTIGGPGTHRYNDNSSISNNLIINAGSTLTTANSSLSAANNWTNNGTFNPGTGTVLFTGGNAQTFTNCATCSNPFYNLTISKSANNLTTAANSSMTVNNNLLFDVGNTGYINARTNNNWVTVLGTVTRTGLGHVDGSLRINIPVDATTASYAIGNGASYTPLSLSTTGTGGTAGLLGAISNTRVVAMAGSGLDATKNVERQWDITVPAGSPFTLGAGRTYDLTTNYLNPADLRGAPLANPLLFETRRWNGAVWNVPVTGNRTTTQTTSLFNNTISSTNTFVVGEPSVVTFYSIANGNWNSTSSWSTARYGGEVYAGTPTATSRVRIGDGKTIDMNVASFTLTGDSVIVETAGPSSLPGRLNMQSNNIITGTGFFALESGGILGVGSSAGITTTAGTGNIQVTVANRLYNHGNHNNGHIIYNGTANQFTGNALSTFSPKTLTVNNSGKTVTLSSAVTILDSIHIQAGTLDVSATNYALTVGGNWRNAGTFTPQTGTVTFNGTSNQFITKSTTETFNSLTLNKASGVLRLSASTDITVNGTLTFTAGILDARTNSRWVTSAGTVTRSGTGHVNGELRKNIASGNPAALTFEVGSSNAYTPAVFDANGAGGTAGFIGVNAVDTNHPNVNNVPFTLDTAKNVFRYWKLTIPAGSSFVLGAGRTYDLTVTFLNPDDIRGGANTANFVMRRWDGSWSTTIAGIRTTTTTQATGISTFGTDFVVGEPPPLSRVFYTRANGAWNVLNTWSTTDYGGPVAADYPNLSGDVAYVGNGNRVTLDQNRTIGSVTVENIGGTGTLSFGTFVLSGAEFTLKTGGKIEVGSTAGITTAGATGNVQTTIRNYNHNTHNNGNFVYNGTANQATGNGLPAIVATIESNNPTATVTLSSTLTVNNLLTITSGTFSCNNLTVNLKGNWVNNSSPTGFTAGTGLVTITGDTDQTLGGSQQTTFNQVSITKTGGSVSLGATVQTNGSFAFNSNSLLLLNTYNLIIGTAGTLTTGTSFGPAQMVQSDGSATSGSIIKLHATGAAGQRDFTFPIGVGTNYNPATIQCRGDFAANSQTALQVRSGLHPNRVGGTSNLLSKWWKVTTSGVSNIVAANTNLNFTYQTADVNGTQANYIPARYLTASGWEVNLGVTRSANTSPITINQESGIVGDWTAGEPGSFFTGRVYYSLANGNWNTAASWSNINHTGSAAVYYPGEKFAKDTVIIANNNTITYNPLSVTIDTMRIGPTAAGTNGILNFVRNSNKKLTVLNSLLVTAWGTIGESGANNRFDTLQVNGNFTNNNTTANAVDFRQSANEITYLIFGGTGHSVVSGGAGTTGWRLSTVVLNKTDGLASKLFNLSTTFSNALCAGASGDQVFSLNSGVYRHDNTGTAILDADAGGSLLFRMGVNSGIELLRGEIDILDTMRTNTNTTINISGGLMIVGTADNEHFRYETGTTFTMTGGELRCAAAFTRCTPQSALNFNLSGGILRVMYVACTAYGVYGFDIASAASIFNWSGGTIVITRISSDVDYKVGATTFNVTGGTLQCGETGVYIGNGGSIALGSPTAPLWDLYIKFTRSAAATRRSAIFYDGDFQILHDIIIDPDGCLDLNTNSFTLGGSFTNNGVFTPDGLNWNNGGGTKRVTLNGSGVQTINIFPAIATTPDNTTFQNEAFFDLIVDKPSGNVLLGTLANSNLIVRNTLIFSSSNNAVIDSRTNSKYVLVNSQVGGDLGQVQRLGLGHVDGALQLNVPINAQTITYDVGTSTDYTPSVLQTVNNGGTAGIVQCMTTGTVHPQITNPPVNLTRDIERYWRYSRPSGAFALGTRTFNITTTFLTSDIPPGANWSSFEHFSLINTTLPWNYTTIGNRTTNSTQSTGYITFNNTANDFVVGERNSISYYSIVNGNWNSPNTWSTVGYGGPPAGSFPNGTNHQAYIGDGKTITLNTTPLVKLALIENAGSGPGRLDMQAQFIQGDVFTLSDSCTISTANEFGLRAIQNLGSVRTTTRNMGNANYIYNSNALSQTTGDGLPSATPIMSLTVNNTTVDSSSAIVYLSNDAIVTNNIYLQKGYLDGGSKLIQLKGDLIVDNGANFNSNLSTFTLNNASSVQNITLNNSWGTLFNILDISKNAGSVVVGGTSNVNIFAKNRIKFDIGNNATLNTRLNNRKAVITSTGVVERNGNGFVDGTLQKYITNGAATTLFEIGNAAVYTPATLILDNTSGNGAAGPVNAINLAPLPNEVFSGNRMDPLRSVPRYWSITGETTFLMGQRKANVLLQFPPAEMATIDLSLSVMRRKSIPAEAHLYTDRRNLTWNNGIATVTLAPAETQWPGLGEFYIGNKAKRIFYSRQTGNWDVPNNWSFTGYAGAAVPAGEYPNPDWNWGADETETRDSVIIGGGYSITLNTLPQVAYTEVDATGTLIIPDGNYLDKTNLLTSAFIIKANGNLNLKSSYGIEPMSAGALRFDDATRTFDAGANYEFSGSLNQTFGTAFPTQINNLTLNNDLNTRIVSAKAGDIVINGNLSINTGQLRPLDNSTNLRLVGNLTVNGTYDGTINSLGNPVLSNFTFQGAAVGNQVVSGTGTLNFANLTMNRGNVSGAVQLDKKANISNILNLQEGANSFPQIIALGSGVDLFVSNNSANAIQNMSGTAPLRYIRTSQTSGLLIRNVTTSLVYSYPVGSFDLGVDNYTPFTYTAGNTGTNGKLGVRVSPGTSPDFLMGHLFLPVSRTTDFLRRYWAVDSVTTTINGVLRFDYLQSDVVGNENLFIKAGRWTLPKETNGGLWKKVDISIDRVQNYFQTLAGFPSATFTGDYTLANIEAFMRIFYSRQTGNWNDENSWTFSPTHSGAIYGSGVWPNDIEDSVVIGKGNLGVGNHNIVLNVPTASVAGIALGTTSTNSGTLDCGPNIIQGGYFTMSDYSTLKIGSPQGITTSGATGSIQTTSRIFTNSGFNSFEYNGSVSQVLGDALPSTVRSFAVSNTGLAGNNIVTLDKNISVMDNLTINSGNLDLQTFTTNNTTGIGAFSLAAPGTISLSGSSNFATAVNNYSSYAIDPASMAVFYGNNQTISTLPLNLLLGFGHVTTTSNGTKIVNSSILVRGNLFNQNGATLQNDVGVDALQVLGSVINSAAIINSGVIEIGPPCN